MKKCIQCGKPTDRQNQLCSRDCYEMEQADKEIAAVNQQQQVDTQPPFEPVPIPEPAPKPVVDPVKDLSKWFHGKGTLKNSMPPQVPVGVPCKIKFQTLTDRKQKVEDYAENGDEENALKACCFEADTIAEQLAAYFSEHPDQMNIRSIWRAGSQTKEWLVRIDDSWRHANIDAAILAVNDLIRDEIYLKCKFSHTKAGLQFNWTYSPPRTSTLTRALALAGAQQPIATNASDIDSHPFIVGLPNNMLWDAEKAEARPRSHDSWEKDGCISKQLSHSPADVISPEFSAVIDAIVPCPLEQTYLQCFFGTMLIKQAVERKLLWIYDKGGSGKTTLLKAIVNVCNAYITESASSLILTSFTAGSSFTVESMRAKIMNSRGVIIDEVDDSYHTRDIASNQFKKATGGGRATGRRIGQDAETDEIAYNILVASNKPPQFEEYDNAIDDRLVVLPLNSKPIQNKISDFGKYLSTKHGDSIAKWVLDGMANVLARGMPPSSQNMIDAKADIKARCQEDSPDQHIADWADQHIIPDEQGIIPLPEAIKHFKGWLGKDSQFPRKLLQPSIFAKILSEQSPCPLSVSNCRKLWRSATIKGRSIVLHGGRIRAMSHLLITYAKFNAFKA